MNKHLLTQQQTLTNDRDAARSTMQETIDEIERLRKNQSELLRLRGEVGMLRRQTGELDTPRKENAQLQQLAQSLVTSNQEASQPPVVTKIIVTRIKQPQVISEEQIRTNLSVKVGAIFNPLAIDLDVRNFQGSGFFQAVRVTNSTTDEGVVVNYIVQEKPKLTGIQFAGNSKRHAAELSQILASKVGEPLDERRLFNDAQKIQELYLESGFPHTKVNYAVSVNEDGGEGEATFNIVE